MDIVIISTLGEAKVVYRCSTKDWILIYTRIPEQDENISIGKKNFKVALIEFDIDRSNINVFCV